MRTSLIKTLATSVALLSNPVAGALTASEMVTNIKTLTSKSQALQAPAASVNIINGPLIVIGLGPFPAIITGFLDIVTTATASVAQMQGSAQVTDATDADSIADAFRDFVTVHQSLLNTLIGKAGLFTTVPLVGAPVASVLRQVEGIVDTLAYGLIGLVESQAETLQSQLQSLDTTLDDAVSHYDGILG